MFFWWIDPAGAEAYTIVNFMKLYLNLNTQLASQISLSSSISKKRSSFVLLLRWQLRLK